MAAKPLVVITGASSGFGEAAAVRFSAAGHPLLLLARRLDRMEALALPNTLCRAVDVTDRTAIDAAVQAAEQMFGPTDLLINNAGLMQLGKMDVQDPSQWDAMIDVNVKGVLNCIHAVYPSMKQRRTGTIINVSSVAGKKTFPDHTTYCGTKFAVHAITEGLRAEAAAHNVRVSVVAPGAAETELLSHTTDQKIIDGYEKWKVSMGGVMNANDVVDALEYVYKAPQRLCIREVVLCATGQGP